MKRAVIGSVIFFVLAPGSTAGLVPWLSTGWRHDHHVGVLGAVVSLAGLVVAVAAFVQFVREGRGAQAPVAPTQELVVGGPYRYVRNPMDVAVASMIAGQALIVRSVAVLVWLAAFLAAVVSFVTWYEEPTLRRTCRGIVPSVPPGGAGLAAEAATMATVSRARRLWCPSVGCCT